MEKHIFPSDCIGNKREDYLPLEATFMGTAMLWASRSKDPSTQVGVCYVNTSKKILSVGYNGAPNGWDDDVFPWGKDESKGKSNTKYPYVIHAEKNGITNYEGSLKDFRESTAYVTLFPCPDCANLMVQVGVKRVVYLSNKYQDLESTKQARTILEQSGVEYISFEELNKEEVSNVDLDYTNRDEPVKIKKIGQIKRTN